MSAETDRQGRLYIPKEIREKYGKKYHIVQYKDRIELIPAADDPLATVREAAGDSEKRPSGTSERRSKTRRKPTRGRRLVVKPVVPLSEIDQFVLDSRDPVLIEHFVHGSSQSFRIDIRKILLVIEEYSRMIVLSMQRFEIFGVVRYQDRVLLCTPLQKRFVRRVFTESVFRLFDNVTPFAEQSLEDTTDVFVKKKPSGRHWTVSLGFSDDSRTRSNASSFSRSNSRISSICA